MVIIKDVVVDYKLKQDYYLHTVLQINGNMTKINGENVSGVLTSNEKIARQVSGLESGATFNTNEQSIESMAKAEAISKFNQKVDEYVDKLEKHEQQLQKNANKLADDLNGVEAVPLYEGVLIKPFNENPFQRIKKEGNLIVDTGGLIPEYKSREDGEWHEEEKFIRVGVVIEVGPTCKYVKESDIVMWRKPSETPIPFYKQGWVQVNEHSLLTAFNTKLSKRFNNGK